jgi:hypothetical protein
VGARLEIQERPKVKNPKTVQELLSISFTSHDPIDPKKFGIDKIQDQRFLIFLASALAASLDRTFHTAHRVGWNRSMRWRLGRVQRVYWDKRNENQSEPDEFGRGIAGLVKTLYATANRLVAIDIAQARLLVGPWQKNPNAIFRRLWAALASESVLIPAQQVEEFVGNLSDDEFWDLNSCPEFTELRATRIRDLSEKYRLDLLARVRRGPPKKLWKGVGAAEWSRIKTYWAVRELKRLEACNYKLPARYTDWVAKMSVDYPDLKNAVGLRDGFLGGTEVDWVKPDPDNSFDKIDGDERLEALEKAFTSARRNWNDDPGGRAADWLSNRPNVLSIVADLKLSQTLGSYPEVLERVGWVYGSTTVEANATDDARANEFSTFANIILRLPKPIATEAIEGVTNWFDSWKSVAIQRPHLLVKLWNFLWPLSVEATNRKAPEADPLDLNLTARTSDDHEPEDLDTLNTPTGRLVGVFFEYWASWKIKEKAFAPKSPLRRMRDKIFVAEGRSGQIAKHRFVEVLTFFLNADPKWTKEKLVPVLRSPEERSTALWRALAGRRISTKVIRLIGSELVVRLTDPRLGRESRKSLLFYVVVEWLHAYLRKKRPAISEAKIMQVIRNVEDELRSNTANILMMFLRDNAKEFAPEQLYRDAVAPFLAKAWPQERELVTPGVSKSLADMPAFAGQEFSSAVDAIERYLVPFECWSLLEYGFFDREGPHNKLESVVDSRRSARSLLKLLDLTIGHSLDAVVPYDLATALNRIRLMDKDVEINPAYKRLVALTRRA